MTFQQPPSLTDNLYVMHNKIQTNGVSDIMQNTEETKANFTPKAVDFFNTNLTDIVADFFTNNDVSALNDKINTFKEQYIELNKSIKSAPQASTDDIDSDLDLEKTQEQKPTSNEENISNIQGIVATKDTSLDAEDSISNDQLLDLRSVILKRLNNLNNEQKIHLEKTLTTEFLKDLIKLLADEKTSNNNKINQNIIFKHSGMDHINFDVRTDTRLYHEKKLQLGDHSLILCILNLNSCLFLLFPSGLS